MAVNTKWKTGERKFAKSLSEAAGPMAEAVLRQLTTSTGRIGHLTELGFDLVFGSGPTGYVGEVKRRAHPKWLLDAWVQLVVRAHQYERKPMLCLELRTEDLPQWVPTGSGKVRMPRHWCAVPLEDMAALLRDRRVAGETRNMLYKYLSIGTVDKGDVDYLLQATHKIDDEGAE